MADRRSPLAPAIRAVATAEHALPAPPLTFGSQEWNELRMHAQANALTGMIFAAWANGVVSLTDSQLALVARDHSRSMHKALHVERTLLRAIEQFEARGIEYRVLKGVALANTIYSDPAYRPFNDADVVIRPGHMREAVDALVRLGGRRAMPEVSPGFDERFAKDVTVILDGVAMDLHRTLIAGPFGVRLRVEDLFSQKSTATLGGRSADLLRSTDLYLHAALTAGAGDVPPRSITLTDLLHLESAPDFDVQGVVRRSTEWHVGIVVARAVTLLNDLLQPEKEPALLPWAQEYPASPLEKSMLSTYMGRGHSYRRTAAMVASLPRWRQRRDFARAILMPSKTYLAARGWSRRHHFKRAAARLAGRRIV